MLSYSGIIGHGSGKTTLPSVDSWGTNMNILRDPPRSLQTKQTNPHISQTMEIVQMIQDSGDRSMENILVYPRGVNPMVDVSYDNYGNNGGQRRGNRASAGLVDGESNSGKQSFLPYRIMQGGAFRPPAYDQRELLPLSRLPRVWTSSYTKPGFADFTRKLMCPTGKERQTKTEKEMRRGSIRPTMAFKLETPIVENYEVKNVIRNPLQVSVSSGLVSQKRINGEIGAPAKMVHDPMRTEYNVNIGGHMTKDPELFHMNTDRYTHDMLYGDNNTNLSTNFGGTPIDQLYNVNTQERIKDRLEISHDTIHTGYTKHEYIHDDIELERTLPHYESRTNSGQNIYKRTEEQISEREYYQNRPSVQVETGTRTLQKFDAENRSYNLRPTINAGSFESIPTIPTANRENNLENFDIDKSRMRQRVYDMQHDRVSTISNTPYMPGVTPV